jgi:hypothetical protein
MMWNPYGPSDTASVEVVALGYALYNALGEAVTTTSVGGSRVRLTVGFTPIYMETFGSFGVRGIVPLLPKGTAGV